MTYLASPYSHPDPAVRHRRFQAAAHAAARLMRKGLKVFSPIAHSAPIQTSSDLPGGWAFWRGVDEWFLRHCDSVRVLMLPGWTESEGVGAEVGVARRLGLPVHLLEPDSTERALVEDSHE